MSKKKLYIIRHGQTEYNLRNIVQGRGIDSDLNEVGRKQAAAFYEKYKEIGFDKIYVSSLKRTVQTVDSFIQDGIPYEKLKGLDEIGWGSSEGKDLTKEILDDFDRILEAWRNNELDVKLPTAESPLELVDRLKPELDYILSKEEEKTVLICTHGRTMRILLCTLTGTPLYQMDQFHHENTCLYILEQNSEGKFEVTHHFDTAHLIEMEGE